MFLMVTGLSNVYMVTGFIKCVNGDRIIFFFTSVLPPFKTILCKTFLADRIRQAEKK